MKEMQLIIAASALCLAASAQAADPAFIKLGGVEGGSTRAQPAPQPAADVQAQRNQSPQASTGMLKIRKAKGSDQEHAGGPAVASGDINGDGRAQAALLVPAVQKVRLPAMPEDQPTATSSQGPYQLRRPNSAQAAPAKPKPKPSGPTPSDPITLNYPKPQF